MRDSFWRGYVETIYVNFFRRLVYALGISFSLIMSGFFLVREGTRFISFFLSDSREGALASADLRSFIRSSIENCHVVCE